MKMLTARQIFDKVKKHLLLQDKVCINGMSCMYKLVKEKETLKCALGVLIFDKYYGPEIEGGIPRSKGYFEHAPYTNGKKKDKLVVRALERSGVDVETHLSLLEVLQNVHDSHPLHKWASRLEWVREKYFPKKRAL